MTVQVRKCAARRDRQTPSSSKPEASAAPTTPYGAAPTLFSLSILGLRPLYESRERLVYPLDPKLRFNLQDFSESWSASQHAAFGTLSPWSDAPILCTRQIFCPAAVSAQRNRARAERWRADKLKC